MIFVIRSIKSTHFLFKYSLIIKDKIHVIHYDYWYGWKKYCISNKTLTKYSWILFVWRQDDSVQFSVYFLDNLHRHDASTLVELVYYDDMECQVRIVLDGINATSLRNVVQTIKLQWARLKKIQLQLETIYFLIFNNIKYHKKKLSPLPLTFLVLK